VLKLKGKWEMLIWVFFCRLMSQAPRKITGNIGKSTEEVVFPNQLRQNCVTYGSPEASSQLVAMC